MMLYEKPDPTRYPNTQTRPDPKPEKVQPATPLLETILMDGGALCGISLHTFMKQFVDEDGKFEYSLEVKNLKKEAKDENYESGISDDDQDSKK